MAAWVMEKVQDIDTLFDIINKSKDKIKSKSIKIKINE